MVSAHQLPLLDDPTERVLLDDASGRIVYVPRLLALDDADALFATLRERAPWHQDAMWMYERTVDVPRLRASLEPPYDPLLATAIARAEDTAHDRYDAVSLNLYRDERDSVAPHSDHAEGRDPRASIALLSLGAPRRMTIRERGGARRRFDLDLEPGSLLVMAGNAQTTYEHGIPKERKASGPRISVAFRRRLPEGMEPEPCAQCARSRKGRSAAL